MLSKKLESKAVTMLKIFKSYSFTIYVMKYFFYAGLFLLFT
jgi:hypothetical protein